MLKFFKVSVFAYFHGQYKADGLGFTSLEQSSSTLSEKKKYSYVQSSIRAKKLKKM